MRLFHKCLHSFHDCLPTSYSTDGKALFNCFFGRKTQMVWSQWEVFGFFLPESYQIRMMIGYNGALVFSVRHRRQNSGRSLIQVFHKRLWGLLTLCLAIKGLDCISSFVHLLGTLGLRGLPAAVQLLYFLPSELAFVFRLSVQDSALVPIKSRSSFFRVFKI